MKVTRLALAVAALHLLASAARATAPTDQLWITGLRPGDAPVRVEVGAPGSVKADTVLWQEGRPIAVVKAGQDLPKDLPAGVPLSVAVMDSSGKPAAGVALQYRPEGLPNLPEPFGRVKTDDHGRATLPVEPERAMVLWIDDPAFLPMVTPLPPATRKVDLLAVRCTERLLLVRDAHGRALAGAHVKAMPLDALSDPLHAARNRASLVRELRGDEVGRVPLPRNFGRVCACAWVPGCTVGDLPSVDAGVTVVLQPAQFIRVKVTGPDPKKPVKGVRFKTTFASGRIPWLAFGEKGVWEEGEGTIVPGAYECKLELKAPGWADLTRRLAEPPAGGRLDLALRRGVTLAGVVVDPGGAPIPKASVQLGDGWDALSADTDPAGSFSLSGVARADAPLTLFVSADGFLDREVPGVRAEENRSLRIVLDRGGSIVGRVVDADSREPVSGATVGFTAEAGRSSRGLGFKAEVAADGTFRAAGLDPGAYDMRAWAPGSVASLRTVTLAAGETQDVGEVELSGHPAVKGRLQDEKGDPPSSSARVHLARIIGFKEVAAEMASKALDGSVAEDGAFQVRGVAPGRYRFVAEDGGAKKVLGPLTVGDDDVDLGRVTLARSASLSGRLVSRAGQDVASWRIALLTHTYDFDPATAYSDQGGAFTFDDLPAGVYYLSAYPPLKMAPEAQQRVELVTGGHLDVVVPIGGVTVTAFLTVDGSPAPGASVRVGGPSDSLFETGVVALWSEMGKVVLGLPAGIRTATADPTGRAALEGLTPGPAQASLTLNALDYRLPVTIPADPQAPVTWGFQGLRVDGKVLRPDGSPGAGLAVAVGYPGVGAMPGTGTATGADGSFRITGLGEGAITLGCRDEAGAAATTTVHISAGQPPAPVTLQLEKAGGR